MTNQFDDLNLKLKAAEIVKSGLEIFTKFEDGDIETIFIISDVVQKFYHDFL